METIFGGSDHQQVAKRTALVIKQEPKNPSSLFMEHFLWKLYFLRQRQQQKRRLVSETLKAAVCPKFIALSATGHLGKRSWPRPPSECPVFIFVCPKGNWCGKVWEAPLYKESLEPHGHWSWSRKTRPVPSVLGCLPLVSTHDHGLPIGGQGLRSWGLPWQNVLGSFSPEGPGSVVCKAKLETTPESWVWNSLFLCSVPSGLVLGRWSSEELSLEVQWDKNTLQNQ